MSTIHKITPENQPVFPCWLWDTACLHWTRRINVNQYFTQLDLHNERLTHWHPDQPTAPTKVPEPLTIAEAANTPEKTERLVGLFHGVSPTPPEGATPETDRVLEPAADWHVATRVVHADFARQLERQRDEARRDLKQAQNDLFWLRNKVLSAAGPAAAKSACEQQMTQNTISVLHADRVRLESDLAAVREENRKMRNGTSAGYVFNQMRRAWVALGEEPHSYRPHKFIEVCTILRQQLTAAQQELAATNASLKTEKECADMWRAHYRKEYGHAWENRNTGYQGI